MSEVHEFLKIVERYAAEVDALALEVWKNPELAFKEFLACKLQCELLKKWGFEVTENYCGFETSYRCEYGSGSPAFAITSEYDALPGIGHGCGHNLICGAALGAFIALVDYLKANNIPGKVILIGTPAEESGSSKVKIVNSGALDGVDAAMMVHPSWRTCLDTGCLSIKRFDVVFKGKAAHASGSPHLGINALDAMTIFMNGINAWRQQLPKTARVHGIITNGGTAANVIPDYTAGVFYVRSDNNEYQKFMEKRFEEIAQGAALIAGCEYKLEQRDAAYSAGKPNEVLAGKAEKMMMDMGLKTDLVIEEPLSTDFANVCDYVPGLNIYFDVTEGEAIALHSIPFREAAADEKALKNTANAAAILAKIALDYLTDPEFRRQIKTAR